MASHPHLTDPIARRNIRLLREARRRVTRAYRVDMGCHSYDYLPPDGPDLGWPDATWRSHPLATHADIRDSVEAMLLRWYVRLHGGWPCTPEMMEGLGKTRRERLRKLELAEGGASRRRTWKWRSGSRARASAAARRRWKRHRAGTAAPAPAPVHPPQPAPSPAAVPPDPLELLWGPPLI